MTYLKGVQIRFPSSEPGAWRLCVRATQMFVL
jgi:hypothetical protein